MPPRWNAWTHLQSVQFAYEREPKMRQVRLATGSPMSGEPVRIGVSGVEVECMIVSVAAGLLTVKVKPTPEGRTRCQQQDKTSRLVRVTSPPLTAAQQAA